MSWPNRARAILPIRVKDEADRYRIANIEVIRDTLAGQGPHRTVADPEQGMRVVFNISAKNALAFLDVQSGKPGRGAYLNRRAAARVVGQPLKGSTIRDRVDDVLADIAPGTLSAQNAHYGAMELNGTGMAYFGDICLVLKTAAVPQNTLTLLRNSYDLTVAPVVANLYVPGDRTRTHKRAVRRVREWAGLWSQDVPDMAVVKLLQHAPPSERRLTTGQISDRLLEDEDYIEVVLAAGFTPADVHEIRLSAQDVAKQGHIADALTRGPVSSVCDLLWRHRRRAVQALAQRSGMRCRVVTATGRSRA
ncbi:hypothetical protein ROLI_018120 [Roseobacter fucihabitans]|uniref:Uncharacterized protein n=1 Tax=Roseobacter fucihabitans TaxID=1537242 RepID=A0ABZ2BTU3_9RHOB|nr:hypothetical protein [Roseobacter litoralis]MBC6965571.1 hypothetical protein [Roseobacter litoralis]